MTSTDDLERLFDQPARGGVFEVVDGAPIGERLTRAGWSVSTVDQFDDLDGFYRRIAAVMGFPRYFGHNLDALWDCLRGVPERSAVIIVWARFADRDPAAARRVRSVLDDRAGIAPAVAFLLTTGTGRLISCGGAYSPG